MHRNNDHVASFQTVDEDTLHKTDGGGGAAVVVGAIGAAVAVAKFVYEAGKDFGGFLRKIGW
jgi:formiminotetrahydrofolate cyclodeaminase